LARSWLVLIHKRIEQLMQCIDALDRAPAMAEDAKEAPAEFHKQYRACRRLIHTLDKMAKKNLDWDLGVRDRLRSLRQHLSAGIYADTGIVLDDAKRVLASLMGQETRPLKPRFDVLEAADLTILWVLSTSKIALTVSQIVQGSARLLQELGSIRAKQLGLVLLSRDKVMERLPILETMGLIERPIGRAGKPTKHKGVGISDLGLQRLSEEPQR
jgi:hypothetical protein